VRRRPREPGLTLLELLIVLALMALMAAVTLPMLGNGVSTTELRSSARQLAAGLRMARSEALVQRREAFLLVDVTGRRFRLDSDSRIHRLPEGITLKLFTAQNDLVDGNVGAIRFFPDGGSNGGRITVAAGERKFEVDVDWLTGRVAILD
jgi:general secretion pathway protein H